ncbi:MAG: PAS domain-containing protein [Bacillota bacterium]|jgi:predicted transcriptional regulator YheO|nr:PAS domain-containing protein [Bacillota bacterium]MDD3297916.1 PAS domain-containing protein [Bacillota bacterium]MDD3850574.1 PAS domain-containing protein [Bacillota bacterium]MDD4707362.1 PAS domain-containing protein [Bacillota bacterium]
MDEQIFKHYSRLVEFLGKTLGPDYEVVLHDVSDYTNSIVAIANGHVSGRSIGAPLTNLSLNLIADKGYKDTDYKINYSGISKDGKILRSSSLFIKDENEELVGLLCINFDDTKYVNISRQILSLCHPDELIDKKTSYKSVNSILDDGGESFSDSITEVIETVLNKVLSDKNIPIERLTQEERLSIVDALNQKGIFMLKGAVCEVAKQLHCSEPSVYRYLSKLNNK